MRIKVLIVEPEKEPYVKLIPNILSNLQEIVGNGFIDIIRLEDGVDIIVNDEGKIRDMPFNRCIPNDVIAGTFIVAGERHGETISLSEEKIEQYKDYFSLKKHKPYINYYKEKYKKTSNLVDICFYKF